MPSSRCRIIGFIIAFCLGVSVVFSPAMAQTQADIARVEKEMKERREKAANLDSKAKAVSQEISSLRSNLIEATRALQGKQDEQNKLESRLAMLEKETASRAIELHASQERLSHMTGMLLQLSRRPPGLLLLHEESTDDHIHRTILLRSLLPHVRSQTSAVVNEIEAYRTLQEQMSEQKRLVVAARQNLLWQRHNLDQLVKVRQGMLSKTQAEKDAISVQLQALTNEAQDLKDLMEKVSRPSWRKTVEGAPKAGKEPEAELNSGLRMPVSGQIVRGYGQKDDFGVVSEGMLLKGDYGAPVVAPRSGRVVFVGPFRGYGKIVILQHAGGYHTFLSGFSRIDAEMAQQVGAGEPLGVLAEPSEGVKPEIYFEWRKGTTPINPQKLS
ncbi:MAG: hypothetical protein EOM37_04420 [Proteobacteria bacterium]|nr:peptidoglycan DD-metalloendopeptidase family protein [Alphaproteobacteria bacterium]NCC03278.1 hypothetical protein [Pseudomonadota bacterium]